MTQKTAGAVPTIQDVARVAGVSTATVSRALTMPERVSENLREKVNEAVLNTGYRVNHAARNLRRKQAHAILVLAPSLGNPFFSRIIGAITDVAASAGYNVLISDTKTTSATPSLLELPQDGRADGIIILDGSIPTDVIERCTLPIVAACEWIEGISLPTVAVDNHLGARRAAAHLVELGHTDIGLLRGPENNVLSIARIAGIEAELGRTVQADWNFRGDFTLISGALAARKWLLLAESKRPTAVFCCNDESAFGFIAELHRAGVSVPRDVSVMGFDDIDLAPHFIPSLTTIRQPREMLGRYAAELLLTAIKTGQKPGYQPLLPVDLVTRSSTAPR